MILTKKRERLKIRDKIKQKKKIQINATYSKVPGFSQSFSSTKDPILFYYFPFSLFSPFFDCFISFIKI